MRKTYLITYDVSCAKRLRLVFRTLRGYGDHLQLSVFCCDLSPSERVILQAKLSELIHHEQDQIVWVDMGPQDTRGRRALSFQGRPAERSPLAAVII